MRILLVTQNYAPEPTSVGLLGTAFTMEHEFFKGRLRDTAYFSILEDEWPACRDALLGWLDPANFAANGTALRGLAEIRTGW